MKKLLLPIAAIVLTTAVFAQKKIADVAKFDSETISFGKIKQGIPVKGTFTLTNISNEPIIIEQANPTCGCTISDYTKTPIAPGKTGVINATYNAANPNHFEKHLTVKIAGIEEVKSITFVGDVIPAEEFDKAKAEEPAKAKVEESKPAAPAAAAATTPQPAKKNVPAKPAVKKKTK